MAEFRIIEVEANALVGELEIVGRRIDDVVLARAEDVGRFDSQTGDREVAGQGELEVSQGAAKNLGLATVSRDTRILAIERIGLVAADE